VYDVLKFWLRCLYTVEFHTGCLFYNPSVVAAVAMQSELAHETLDRQNQAMTENLAMKVSRLRDVYMLLSPYSHC